MKKQLLILPLIITSCISAGPTESAGLAKICVYDVEMMIEKCDEWRLMMSEMEKQFKPRVDALQKEGEALRNDGSKFQAKSAMMNDASRDAELQELQRRDRNLKMASDSIMQDQKEVMGNMQKRFGKKLGEGMESFMTVHGFDKIEPKQPLSFASARIDQTNAIAEHLNKRFANEKKTLVATASKPAAPVTKIA